MTKFSDLGLTAGTLRTLESMEFTTPTPIQVKAIPLVLERRDIIGLAQTGTGKTAAFGLPIIEHLLNDNQRPEPKAVRTLILAPTRELVNQITGNLRAFLKDTKLRIALVVGGASIHKQAQLLARGTDILVATPGRLLDLCKRNDVNLTAVRYLVLDEADQMLDLGFIHDLRRISKMVPKRRQTLLFSATMPKQIEELAQEYLTDPLRVEASTPGKTADKIEQFVHHVTGKDQKTQLLRQSLTDNPDGRAMVFLKTKHSAEKLSKHLENIGFAAASIHGNKSQSQRERALKAFRDGEMRVLVATDVAARGIDIPGVTHVYNYDLPTVAEAYVHRIGRTARAGKEGIAIAFCAPDEFKMLRDIEKLTKVELTVASGEAPADTRGGNQPSRGAPRPARKQHRKGQGRPQQAGEGAEARAEGQARPARRPHSEAQAGERKRDNGGNNGHHQAGRPNGDRNRPGGQKRGARGGKPGGYTRAAQG
ncbi:DEAD/DEAH box helicase [Rhizobium sp. C4]|uniref:DEAD/DEAH box helicase n=1 Tax=Rhizobium sp. C4 TaxID=1349800 RepID=UPI001E4C8299|nr:DEAD/DEAH box helicase [Rhizobium sp. C4]MCD2173916.1 DEAD/DEAH box helicase [Rhizobium sp. C4]